MKLCSMSLTYSKQLEIYLEIEKILNQFFGDFDFCLQNCVRRPELTDKPARGCCKDRYYQKYDLDHPAFHRLTQDRIKLYGAPAPRSMRMRTSPCEYHTPFGCHLKTHKSPICLSFLCKEGIEYLRELHGIYTYDYLGIHYALEWILTGDLAGHALEEFITSLQDMRDKINQSEKPSS